MYSYRQLQATSAYFFINRFQQFKITVMEKINESQDSYLVMKKKTVAAI